MKNLNDFQVTNNLLDEVNGGEGATPVYFEGANAVLECQCIADCYCWCTCGWAGTGTGTGMC